MNPNDIFWVARYAHRVIAPLVRDDEKLIIHMHFDDITVGVDTWIHVKVGGTVRAFRTALKTKQDVDKFVATLPLLVEASVTA